MMSPISVETKLTIRGSSKEESRFPLSIGIPKFRKAQGDLRSKDKGIILSELVHFNDAAKEVYWEWDLITKVIHIVQCILPRIRIYFTRNKVKFIKNRNEEGMNGELKTTIHSILIHNNFTRSYSESLSLGQRAL